MRALAAAAARAAAADAAITAPCAATQRIRRFTDLRVCVLVGGSSMDDQFRSLADNPDIIVATPGRLMHQLVEVPNFGLGSIEMVVFDEADRLFEMGFAEQLRELLTRMPDHRQTLLFSATMPKQLAEFARAGLRDPQVVRLDVETKISENLKLAFLNCRTDEKHAALTWLLQEFLPADQQVMVFVAVRRRPRRRCAAACAALTRAARADAAPR